MGDPDVMDTWATSSLTPQIAGRRDDDPDLFARVFPMDLRPQAHEIIRTWLFSRSSAARSTMELLPWTDAAISGWVLDPERKKMSKSRGNVVTPLPLLATHGADGVRYWAASGRPGVDTAVDEGQMKVGRRLAIKILNASRFVLTRLGPDSAGVSGAGAAITAPLDLAMGRRLAEVVVEATAALDSYDYARALERTEAFFWSFCDDYLEMVKSRAYEDSVGPGPTSARAALGRALSVQLRLLAPFVPFVTEEAWSWWHDGSIHVAPWPEADELAPAHEGGDVAVLDMAASVLGEIRRVKTTAQQSMRARVEKLTVIDTPERLALLALAEGDVRDAGGVDELVTEPGPPQIMVGLGPEGPRRVVVTGLGASPCVGDDGPDAELAAELAVVLAGCRASHARLLDTVDGLDEAGVRAPSLLAGWTVGHVLTHLARNADSHTRMLGAALAGRSRRAVRRREPGARRGHRRRVGPARGRAAHRRGALDRPSSTRHGRP